MIINMKPEFFQISLQLFQTQSRLMKHWYLKTILILSIRPFGIMKSVWPDEL